MKVLIAEDDPVSRTIVRLAAQARTAPLMGLGNRLRMREDLEVLRARTRRYGQTYCAILLDIDCFKLYNDHYRHPAGDEVLRRVAGAIESHCRSGDTAYRYGGEELLTSSPSKT